MHATYHCIKWFSAFVVTVLLRFKYTNEFVLEICKAGYLKKNVCIKESEIILHKLFFHPKQVQHEVVNGKSLVKC